MAEPAYVRIASDYARRIRVGELAPGSQLPSLAEIAERHSVSDIVVRKAVELLQSQGLVRSVRRRGVFVTDRPNLVRTSPERQTQSAEASFRSESDREVLVDRKSREIPATEEVAEAFGLIAGDAIKHTVTCVSENHRPVSISDTYQPIDVDDVSSATDLEETLADRLPTPGHADWLQVASGDLVKTVYQRFYASDGRLLMISEVSYPQNRYDAFTFRMRLRDAPSTTDDGE
jgi:GntR family transcriptional regulator